MLVQMSVRRAATQHSISEEFHSSLNCSISSSNEDPFSSYTLSPEKEDSAVELQRELKFYFMNPIEKFKARGRKPYKFLVQILKVFIVTLQLFFFGRYQYPLATFIQENTRAMEHLFLENWDVAFDSYAYPSTKDLYALYTVEAVYSHLNNVVYQFSEIERSAIGTYSFDIDPVTKKEIRNLTFHITQYKEVKESGNSFQLNLNKTSVIFNTEVEPNQNISIQEILEENNASISFDRLYEMKINFTLKSIHLQSVMYHNPTCIKFHVGIHYNYMDHSGRLPVDLVTEDVLDVSCTNNIDTEGNQVGCSLALDLIVILLCVVSFILCTRSLANGQYLQKKTVKFFKVAYKKNLTTSDRLEFLNFWYIIICVSDSCIVAGSICKILIEMRWWVQSDVCSLLLGIGTFLVWFGILRYLGFFNKYNILLLTLKKSMPNVMRFSVCAGIIYLAYGFCGWIVLGPYHGKFRTFTIAMECMYSLINGDDMFATFQEMPARKTVIFIFSKIYLYSFISLFIYVVLSLFIAVIMDTYETVRDFQRHGHIDGGDLMKFIALCEDEPESGNFRRKARKSKSIRRYSSFEQTHEHNQNHGERQHLLSNNHRNHVCT